MPRSVDKMLTNFDDQFKIFNHLKAVMEEDGSSPTGEVYYKYKGNWSDAMVGQKFGYTEQQIMRFRQRQKMQQNPRSYATDNLSVWRATQKTRDEKFAILEERVTRLDSEMTHQKGINNALQAQITSVKEEVKRLLAVSNEHASSITELEDKATRPIKSFGDLRK